MTQPKMAALRKELQTYQSPTSSEIYKLNTITIKIVNDDIAKLYVPAFDRPDNLEFYISLIDPMSMVTRDIYSTIQKIALSRELFDQLVRKEIRHHFKIEVSISNILMLTAKDDSNIKIVILDNHITISKSPGSLRYAREDLADPNCIPSCQKTIETIVETMEKKKK